MPIFEYKCRDCGHLTEVLERAGTKGKHACEKCGSRQMEKVLSVFGLGGGGGSAACGPSGSSPFR